MSDPMSWASDQSDATAVIPAVPADPYATQVGGDHYKRYAIQPTEYIIKNKLNFVEGNIIKYVTRYPHKNGLEDLEKARHYLDILIAYVKERDGK